MLAVIETGGKQYMVKSGEALKVEKLSLLKEGDTAVFDKVLLTANDDGSEVKIGSPYLDVKVEALVEKQGKNRTLLVQKFKRKVRYHISRGQRQRYTKVKIA
ncbi:50S ribosomal protein L21 [Patescibacteria group bacterium]|nr:50S ribosomal protein L21 [Patescibacteria group bacterium]MBU1613124.1 50S ribosomal protein L21 [Patescibacteria group bacterium]